VNPTKLRARNYRTFETLDLDLDLPVGCVAITGPNGAGKSSLINLIELALFGSRSLAEYATDDTDGDLLIEMEFEHRGETYRVRRSLTRGKSPKVDFERYVTGRAGPVSWGWEPLTEETAKATDAAISSLLGLSRETFRASSFLAQDDGAAFTEAQPRERKDILAEILGLSVWDDLLACVRRDKANVEQSVAGLTTKIELAEQQIAERPALIAERDAADALRAKEEIEHALQREKLEDALKAVAAAEESANTAEAKKFALAAMRRVASDGNERLSVFRALVAQIDGELSKLEEVEALADLMPELEERLTAAREAQASAEERERLVAERGILTNKIALVEKKPETVCDRCGQHLDTKAKERALVSLRNDLLAVDARLEEIPWEEEGEGETIRHLENRMREAMRASKKMATLEARAKQREAAIEEIEPLRQSLPGLQHEIATAAKELDDLHAPDMQALRGAVGEARHREVVLSIDVRRYEEAITRADTHLEHIAKVESEAGESIDRLAFLREELDALAMLERAFGRDGIPAMIVENAAIPQIELEANRILDELGTSFRVELRTQRALKSGDGVKEALDIMVSVPGGERLYESFSGGERTRINLALRIALARLLAHRRGAEVRVLAIDEPEFLDDAGHERLASVLRGLLDDFDRILLVSHEQALKDAFDQVIAVEKDDTERSRIASGSLSPYAEEVLS
jgi:DNA repair protein SbcC/Rad50